jgi:hypothetical protein
MKSRICNCTLPYQDPSACERCPHNPQSPQLKWVYSDSSTPIQTKRTTVITEDRMVNGVMQRKVTTTEEVF